MKHFPLKEITIALASIVLLGALYVGSYYATVQRKVGTVEPIRDSWVNVTFRAEYPVGGEAAIAFYSLWHHIDRVHIRPRHWFGVGQE